MQRQRSFPFFQARGSSSSYGYDALKSEARRTSSSYADLHVRSDYSTTLGNGAKEHYTSVGTSSNYYAGGGSSGTRSSRDFAYPSSSSTTKYYGSSGSTVPRSSGDQSSSRYGRQESYGRSTTDTYGQSRSSDGYGRSADRTTSSSYSRPTESYPTSSRGGVDAYPRSDTFRTPSSSDAYRNSVASLQQSRSSLQQARSSLQPSRSSLQPSSRSEQGSTGRSAAAYGSRSSYSSRPSEVPSRSSDTRSYPSNSNRPARSDYASSRDSGPSKAPNYPSARRSRDRVEDRPSKAPPALSLPAPAPRRTSTGGIEKDIKNSSKPPARKRRSDSKPKSPPPPKRSSKSTRSSSSERKRRVSALKRLGPKVSVTDRLGLKARQLGRSTALKKKAMEAIRDKEKNGSKESSADNPDSDKKNGPGMQITINTDPKEKARVVNDDEEQDQPIGGKNFLKLVCPHCDTKCITFKEYSLHQHNASHMKAMKQLKLRLQVTLGRMRTKQRTQQREIEKKLDQEGKNVDENGKAWPPIYCKVCKLVFHQKRADHNSTENHKLISNFLNPKCSICEIQYFSPMAYEKHISSLTHIRKKKTSGEDPGEEDLQKTLDDPKVEEDLDSGDFMTLDEVGEVEDDEEIMGKEEDAKETEEEGKKKDLVSARNPIRPPSPEKKVESSKKEEAKMEETETPQEKKEEEEEIKLDPETPIGEDYVKRVEMFYCDLCHKYLPRTEPEGAEELLKSHCKTAMHQTAFAKKQKEIEAQRAKAEARVEVVELELSGDIQMEEQLDYEAESVNGDV